jgi:hypothetical protein
MWPLASRKRRLAVFCDAQAARTESVHQKQAPGEVGRRWAGVSYLVEDLNAIDCHDLIAHTQPSPRETIIGHIDDPRPAAGARQSDTDTG